ncbi:NERD domain-containing protein [Bradyrhizobium liaoningense]|uniref:NERD domain-containing protein n=1 Tax=Bradyrhizobium liaoningense TaxID=43992 RepID=UPI001BA82007|nr:NERD domain-containing protein [Bradyrhizobium liaoningense]MBR1169698.1 NERD domain-containing protein [Bradyrhizobium liaoningense]
MNKPPVQTGRLREDLVKEALDVVDWPKLRAHLDAVELSTEDLIELCGHIRRCSDWIAKYPRKSFEAKRDKFMAEFAAYARQRLGTNARDKVTAVLELIRLVEHGYRSILDVLAKCAIGKQPPAVRVSACISRGCYDYNDLLRRRDSALRKAKQLDLASGFFIPDEAGSMVSADAVVEGIAASVAMTVIMEAYNNQWFAGEIVPLPALPAVGEEARFQSGATQVMALFWRNWQRLEKRRRFQGGEIRTLKGARKPAGTHPQIEAVIQYLPPEEGMSEAEVYDYLANERVRDRLTQTFMEMSVEHRLLERGVGIDGVVKLPPTDLVSGEEGHAGVSLSEILGYSIASDMERPGGLRLLEWVRGYSVLKELGQRQTEKADASADSFTLVIPETELFDILERCGLERSVANQFVEQTLLHRSSRDMFDCPLVRLQEGKILLFVPAVVDANIAMAVLSNLSNRSEQLSRKGKAFEQHIREVFQRNNIPAFAFTAKRGSETYEYDAVVVWDDIIFVFECKNRSLSGNDPVQAYHFDLEVQSQAKQAARLAEALQRYPDIVEKELGGEHVGKKIVPCVLHSLPYARLEPIDGVYFTDASSLTRFLEQEYFRVKVEHKIGSATLLHRTALKKYWKADKPTAEDLMRELSEPFALSLSVDHLEMTRVDFAISSKEEVVMPELTRKPITTRSACEAVGADADIALKEIAEVSRQAARVRNRVARPRKR